jgi:hypothetical protein
VQPPEPGPTRTTPPLPAKPRNQRLRLFLALGAGILGLLCLGGVAVVVSLYDEATEIDRVEPDQVTSSFLRAYLVNRSDTEAELYQCESGGDFAALSAYRDEIQKVERDFTVGIRVSWGSLTVNTSGSEGTVTAELVRTSTDRSRDAAVWRFGVVDSGGWRVCSATRVS